MSNDLAYAHLYESYPLPLASRYIRLLHVHAPESQSEDSPISTHLETVDLDHEPSYAALSYVWGLAGSFQIRCGAVDIPVTANCHSALWHLRKTLGAFRIWIDAICINQQDILEKEQQIALMRNIFAISNKVYIWTGAGNDATTRAMSYLEFAGLSQYRETVVNTQQERKPRLKLWPAFWGYHRSRWSSTRTLVPEPNVTSEYKWSCKTSPLRNWRILRGKVIVSNDDLEQLLSCAWTTRLWTYQEVIFAASPVIVNGTLHVPWSTFVSSCVLLSDLTTLPSMSRWSEIIQSRAQMRDSFVKGTLEEFRSEVSSIHTFLDRCTVVTSVIQLISWMVLLSCVMVFLIFAHVDPSFASRKVYPGLSMAISIVLFTDLYMYWLPPNPPAILWKPRFVVQDAWYYSHSRGNCLYQPFYTLDSPIRQGLLNTLCWRTSSESKDMVFAILPMIQLAFGRQPFRVDYSVNRSRLYTELARSCLIGNSHGHRGRHVGNLARILRGETSHLDDEEDFGILALAAKARYPGAATWVPDFSQILHPTVGRGYAPQTLRRADPAYTISETSDNNRTSNERYRCTLSRCFTIYAVSDFVDPTRIPDHPIYLRELGEIHNVKCMMYRISALRCRGLPFSDGTHPSELSQNDVLWLQIFQHQFPSSACRFHKQDFEDYNHVVVRAIRAQIAPSRLLRSLRESRRLFNLHQSICLAFANAQGVFYVSNIFFGRFRNVPSHYSETFQHIGVVSGSQQGQIQKGDEIIGVGIQDHVAYRSVEKQLIARLDPEDSFYILRGWQKLEVKHDRVKVHLE